MFMTSLGRHTFGVCVYFGIYGKRRPMIAILWYQLDESGGSVFKFTTNHPPW